MARRAKAAGMRILLDPHYSDFWADPQKQPIPASWPQDLPSLAATVHDYTRDALNALAAQGTPAQMLQLGNEIRNGILWPTGQLDGSADQWDRLGTLLRAAAAGARDAKGPTPRLVVHYDQGGDNAGSRWFFDNIVAQHVPVRRDRPVLLPLLARDAVAAARERRRPRAALRPRRLAWSRPSTGGRSTTATRRTTSCGRPTCWCPATRPPRAGSSASPRTCCRSSPRCPAAAGWASSTGSRSGSRASAGSRARARRTTT